jgi:hypothetical protein
MLPPVVEIFVVWHPADLAGSEVAEQVMAHFHANAFTGLLGGAIEVYPRSEGFRGTADAPRAIPFKEHAEPPQLPGARFVAVVPVLGVGLARCVQSGRGAWHDYVRGILDAKRADPTRIGIFPVVVDRNALDGTELGSAFNEFQRIAEPGAADTGEPVDELRCRDLAQAVAQLIGSAARIKVFISHTTRAEKK